MYYSYKKTEQNLNNQHKGVNLSTKNTRSEKLNSKPAIKNRWDETDKRTFFINFVLFVIETSSIHGLRHLSVRKLHPVEYCLWSIVIIIGMVGVYWLSSSTWHHYQHNPVVISIENNYQDWSTMFPSITVCPFNKMTTSPEIFYQNIIEKKIVQVENEDLLYAYMKQLTNWSYGEPKLLPTYNQVKPDDYIWIYSEGKHKFRYIMSYNEIVNLQDEELEVYITEHGVCYGYLSKVSIFNDPQYWRDKRWDFREGGPRFGSNPLDGDNYFQFTFTDSKGFLAFIHSPEEIPDASSKQNLVHMKVMKTLGLTAVSILSTPETKYLSVSQRKCRFLPESNLPISAIYTYNSCRMNCRHKLVNKLCGCVPYFYRPTGQHKVCDSAGLACASNSKDLLIKLRDDNDERVECKCVPACNDVNYVIEEERKIDWAFGAELRWGIIRYPRIRYKREVLFGFTDMLVSIGGTAGLFLGCSALSFAELIFFSTLRLLWLLKKKENQHKNNTLKSKPSKQKMSDLIYFE